MDLVLAGKQKVSAFNISLPPVPFLGFTWDCCPLIVMLPIWPNGHNFWFPILFSDKNTYFTTEHFLPSIASALFYKNEYCQWIKIKPFTNITLCSIIHLLRIFFFLRHWFHGIFLVENSLGLCRYSTKYHSYKQYFDA